MVKMINWKSSPNEIVETHVDNYWELCPSSWALDGEGNLFLVSQSNLMTS